MNGRECWNISREQVHSPGREFDDTGILRLTGKHLDALGSHVSLKTPDEIPATVAVAPSAMFRCEQTGIDI
jgi:hypothetical protein